MFLIVGRGRGWGCRGKGKSGRKLDQHLEGLESQEVWVGHGS